MTRRTALRAAIVGAGLMGRWHARFGLKAGAVIAGIVDPNPKAAAALQQDLPNASTWTSLEACLNSTVIDVVHVCTPARFHFSLSQLALRHGAHVMVEKPAVGSTAEAKDLADLSRSRRLKIVPVHQFPFQRGFHQLSQNRHRLGDPVRVTFEICTSGGLGLPEGAQQTVLVEMIPHAASVFLALFGSDAVRSLHIAPPTIQGQLNLSGVYNETALQVFFSLHGRPTRNWLTYTGTSGTAHLDFFHGYCVWERGDGSRRSKILRPFGFGTNLIGSATRNLMGRAIRSQWAYPGLGELIGQFYDSIREDGAPPVSETELIETTIMIDRLGTEAQGGMFTGNCS